MTMPVAAQGICLALENGTHEMGQTWERIDTPGDSFVVNWRSHRGRPSEFAKIEGGDAALTLQNRSGTFDPTNPLGPYYTLLDPMKQAKINFQHPIRDTYHDIFSGYTENYGDTRIGPRGAESILTLSDGFEPLNQAHLTPGTSGIFYAVQHVDDRIKAVLGDVGWDADFTRIATGNVHCQQMTYDPGTGGLEAIQEAADSEFPGIGNFFNDKSGYAAFSGRGIRFDPDSYPEWVTRWRVGDAASCALDPTLLPIFDIRTVFGKTALYNEVTCAFRNATPSAIASNRVVDGFSIGKYGRRSLSLLDLIVLDGSTTGNSALLECRDFSNYYVNNFALPRTRISSIEFHGQMDDGMTAPGGESGNLWDFILNVEINHIVEVFTVHPGGGGMEGVEFIVEGITNNVSRLNDKVPRWTMNLDLSPAAYFASYP